jgi:hypothetical protein
MDNAMKKLFGLLILTTLLLTACGPTTSVSTSPAEATLETVVVSTLASSSTFTPEPNLSTSVPTDSENAAQKAAIADLAKKLNISSDQITVISTEPVTWPNGCLGIVLPGVMCTQSLVDGYKIILSANGKQYEYHTNLDGTSAISTDQQLATTQIAVLTMDQKVKLVNSPFPLGPVYDPSFGGFLPTGGSIGGKAYILDFSNSFQAKVLDNQGETDLTFIKSPNYGLAVWSGSDGSQPRLAWGTQIDPDTITSSLMVSNPDGSNLQTLLTIEAGPTRPIQIVADGWTPDGQSVYFSKEPVGIGGYIVFSGASNLYRIDLTSKKVTELIPMSTTSGPQICLDSLSPDYQRVAGHCDQNTITILDIASGKTQTIQPPADVTDFRLLGSARFSPNGQRVAFALAKGDPSAEQGWIAVSDGTSGASKLILTGDAGKIYLVIGWLNDQSLLLQTTDIQCTTSCSTQVLTINIDGTNLKTVADGTYLTTVSK